MASKSKNYLQTQLFPDEDIKLPKHDEIMFWLDRNAALIIDELCPKNIKYLIDDYNKINFEEQIIEAINYLKEDDQKNIEAITRLENLNIYDKNFDRTLPIEILSKMWEFPVNDVNNNFNHSSKKPIGFIDMKVTYNFPSIPRLNGIIKKEISKDWERPRKYKFEIFSDIFIGFERRPQNIFFEVKTQIDSVGVLIRQINYYRNYVSNGKFVVVSEDDRFKGILKEQGIDFVKYDINKYN